MAASRRGNGEVVEVDLVRFWSATAVIAAIAAFAGVTVTRLAGDVFDTPIYVAERGGGALVPLSDGRVVWVAIVVTIVAAGVLNLMLYLVPSAEKLFAMLAIVAMAAGATWSFSLDVDRENQLWLVVLQVVVGAVIASLTLAAAHETTVHRPAPPPAPPPPPT